MSSELAQYLRFYKDLGFTDLNVVEAVRSPAVAAQVQPSESEPPRAPQQPREREGAVPQVTRTPEPAHDFQPIADPEPIRGFESSREFHQSRGREGAVPSPPAAPAMSSAQKLEIIRAEIGDDCRRCKLCEGRSKIVFGSGNPDAKLVFVGEGPGADEDEQGLPFVGRAGQLLTQMIDRTAEGEGIPIRREHVYICNVVKCRPPGNRAPEPDEMSICGRFLEQQLEAIAPAAVCVLGSTAAKALLQTNEGITKMRGEWRKWRDIPVMPTFHPSYLLRAYNKEAKRLAWEDLKKVLHFVYD